jgi:hypothetical protein
VDGRLEYAEEGGCLSASLSSGAARLSSPAPNATLVRVELEEGRPYNGGVMIVMVLYLRCAAQVCARRAWGPFGARL